jgi:chromosome segregation ATPase
VAVQTSRRSGLTQKQIGTKLIDLHERVAKLADHYNNFDPSELQLKNELDEVNAKRSRFKPQSDKYNELTKRKVILEKRLSIKQDARLHELHSAVTFIRNRRRALEHAHSIPRKATSGAVRSGANGLPPQIISKLLG